MTTCLLGHPGHAHCGVLLRADYVRTFGLSPCPPLRYTRSRVSPLSLTHSQWLQGNHSTAGDTRCVDADSNTGSVTNWLHVHSGTYNNLEGLWSIFTISCFVISAFIAANGTWYVVFARKGMSTSLHPYPSLGTSCTSASIKESLSATFCPVVLEQF